MEAINNLIFTIRIGFFQSRVNQFFEELLQQLALGVPLGQFLSSRAQAASSRNSFLAPVYGEMADRMAKGDALHQAGTGVFTDLNVLIIEAGERVHHVEEAVKTASFINESMDKVGNILFENLRFPIFIFICAVGMAFFLGLDIIPEFMALMPLSALGSSYKFFYPLTQWLAQNWIFVLPVFVALIVYVVWSLFNQFGSLRQFYDRFIPPYNLYRLKKAGEFMIIFSGLIRNNVNPDEVLVTIQEHEGKYVGWHAALMRERIADGMPMVEALDTGLLPGKVIELLMSYDNSGKLDQAMQRIGFENVDTMLKIVTWNVLVIANTLKYLSWAIIGWLGYDTLTLAVKLSQFSKSGMF